MKFTLELQDAVGITLKNIKLDEKDFPKENSTEVYTDELIPLLLQLAGGTQKLFWVMVEARDVESSA